jgi:hypothetical protein
MSTIEIIVGSAIGIALAVGCNKDGGTTQTPEPEGTLDDIDAGLQEANREVEQSVEEADDELEDASEEVDEEVGGDDF